MSTPYAVLPLFATKFAACTGGIWRQLLHSLLVDMAMPGMTINQVCWQLGKKNRWILRLFFKTKFHSEMIFSSNVPNQTLVLKNKAHQFQLFFSHQRAIIANGLFLNTRCSTLTFHGTFLHAHFEITWTSHTHNFNMVVKLFTHPKYNFTHPGWQTGSYEVHKDHHDVHW